MIFVDSSVWIDQGECILSIRGKLLVFSTILSIALPLLRIYISTYSVSQSRKHYVYSLVNLDAFALPVDKCLLRAKSDCPLTI